ATKRFVDISLYLYISASLSLLVSSARRIHQVYDPLQVVDRGELDGDLALVPAEIDLDAGVVSLRQPCGDVIESRCLGLGFPLPIPSVLAIVVTDGDNLLQSTYGHPFGHGALRQPILDFGILDRDERSSMAGRQHPGSDAALNRGSQTHESQRIADLWT